MSSGVTRTRRQIDPLPFSGSKQFLLGYFQTLLANGSWSDPGGHTMSNPLNTLGYAGISAKACFDEKHQGPPYESGGPLRVIRTECATPFGIPAGKGVYYYPDRRQRYVGGFGMPRLADFGSGVESFSADNFSPLLVYSNPSFASNLLTWSNKAWSSTAPKLEKAGLGVALAELRDVPRMLKTTSRFFHDTWKSLGGNFKTKTMTPKGAADHFLNHQFGWRPFLKDLDDMCQTMSNSDTIIKRLQDENGQWIRNRATLVLEKTSTLFGQANIMPGFLFPNTKFTYIFDPWIVGTPTYNIYDDYTHSVTSVGQFRYYRPEFDRANDTGYMARLNAIQRQLTIYGIRITPSNVYKATPWTWAADWVSDAGKYVSRVNDMLVDSVACKYLYITERKERTRRIVVSIPFVNQTVSLSWTLRNKTIQREEGSSPYGFGLSMSNLSARQLAIAGALGLTRFF
jgi:hypothetical protein